MVIDVTLTDSNDDDNGTNDASKLGLMRGVMIRWCIDGCNLRLIGLPTIAIRNQTEKNRYIPTYIYVDTIKSTYRISNRYPCYESS